MAFKLTYNEAKKTAQKLANERVETFYIAKDKKGRYFAIDELTRSAFLDGREVIENIEPNNRLKK